MAKRVNSQNPGSIAFSTGILNQSYLFVSRGKSKLRSTLNLKRHPGHFSLEDLQTANTGKVNLKVGETLSIPVDKANKNNETNPIVKNPVNSKK